MSIQRPQLIGLPTRIRLIELVGTGASGTVWRARDSQSGRDVAIKLLNVQTGDALAAERLEREARALSRLTLVEGAVSLQQVGLTADGTAWLILDFAPGGSLQDRIQEEKQPSAAVEGLAQELFLTLAQAHQAGVIHGDISPANVLFSDLGKPLLADFGMSSLVGGGVGADGIVGFTPAYGAPERFGGGPPDQASDVFALAATLWHARFGLPLLRGPNGEVETGREVLQGSDAVCEPPEWMLAAVCADPGSRPDARSLLQQLTTARVSHKPFGVRWK